MPFGGRIDPGKVIDLAPERTYLDKRGEAMALLATSVSTPAPVRQLTHFEAARALAQLGVAMSAELVATLKSLHPEGVPETELPALQARLTVRAGLRVVGGA